MGNMALGRDVVGSSRGIWRLGRTYTFYQYRHFTPDDYALSMIFIHGHIIFFIALIFSTLPFAWADKMTDSYKYRRKPRTWYYVRKQSQKFPQYIQSRRLHQVANP